MSAGVHSCHSMSAPVTFVTLMQLASQKPMLQSTHEGQLCSAVWQAAVSPDAIRQALDRIEGQRPGEPREHDRVPHLLYPRTSPLALRQTCTKLVHLLYKRVGGRTSFRPRHRSAQNRQNRRTRRFSAHSTNAVPSTYENQNRRTPIFPTHTPTRPMKPMSHELHKRANRYPLSLGERARPVLPERTSLPQAPQTSRCLTSNPPAQNRQNRRTRRFSVDSTTLYQVLTTNQNRRTPIPLTFSLSHLPDR
jgi:hypothetical protein